MYKSEQSPHKKANNHNYSLQSGQKSTSGSISNCREIMIETKDKEIPFISIYKPDLRSQQKGLHVIMSIFTANYRVKIAYAFNCLVLLKKAEQLLKSKVILLSQTLKSIIKRQKAHSFLRLCAKKMKNKLIVEALNAIAHLTTKRKRFNMEMAIHKLSLNKYQTIIDSMQEKQLLMQISQLKEEKISQEIVQKAKILQRVPNPQSYIQSLRKCQFQALLKAQQKRFELLRSKVTPKRKAVFDNQLFIVVFANTVKAFQGEYARFEEQLRLNNFNNTEDKHEERLIQLNESIESWTHQIKTMDRQVKVTPFSNPNKLIAVFSNHSKQLKTMKQKAISPIEEMIDSRLFLHQLILKCLNFCVEQKQAQEANRQFAELVSISNEEHKLANFICTVRQNTPIKILAQTILMFHKKITEFETDPHSEDSKQEEISKQILKLEDQCQLLKDKCTQLESKHTKITQQLTQEKTKNQKYLQDYTILEEKYKLLFKKCQQNQQKILSSTPVYEINIKKVDVPTPRSISNRELCQKLNKICIKSAIQLKTGSSNHMMKSTDMMKQLLLIKMQAENQFMSYEKEISILKRENIQYQNVVDQLQASITHRDNQIRRYEQTFKLGHQTKQSITNDSFSLNQQKWRDIIKQKEHVIATLIKQKQQKLSKEVEDDRDARIKKLQQKVQQLNLIKRKSLQKQRQLQQNIRAWQEGLSSVQNQLKQKTNIIDKLQKQLLFYQKDNKCLQDTGQKSMTHNLTKKESKDSLSYSEDHQGTSQILGLVYNILLHSKGKIEKKTQQQLWQDLCDVRQSQSSTFYTRLLNFSRQFITKYQK